MSILDVESSSGHGDLLGCGKDTGGAVAQVVAAPVERANGTDQDMHPV